MKENNERLKTASRLKNWIACNYTTINEINKKELKKKESSTTEKIRKERGDEFEEKIYGKLSKQYPKYIKIKKDGNKFEKTKDAIKKGYDLIHKASFEYKGWLAKLIFLLKIKIKKPKMVNGSMRYTIPNYLPHLKQITLHKLVYIQNGLQHNKTMNYQILCI